MSPKRPINEPTNHQTHSELSPVAAQRWISLFAVLWGMAHLFHIFSDFQTHYAWITFALTPFLTFILGLAALVLVATRNIRLLLATAVLQLIVFLIAFPAVSNHWIVAAMVNLALLIAGTVTAIRRGRLDSIMFWQVFAPTGRWILLTFYAFAAFAKWNSDFFNPAVSCAVMLGEISASSFGISFLFGYPLVQWGVIIGSWAVESTIPVLLFMRRTRTYGVLLGIVFHFALAVDWVRHFYDFSSLLTALFILFLPVSFAPWVFEQIEQELSPDGRRKVAFTAVALLGMLTVAPAVSPEQVRIIAFVLNQLVWFVYAGGVILLVWRFAKLHGRQSAIGMLRLAHPLLLVLPFIMVLNGLMAYGETRRGRSFDMYSNLRTSAGETNHWILPSVPLTPAQSDPIVIVSSQDDELDPYIDSEVAVSFIALRKYLSARPETPLTVQYEGETITLAQAADWPELVAPLPWWQNKLLTFKPLDLRPVNRCFDQIGPLD